MDISEKVRLEEGFWFSPQADYIVFLTINSTKVICNLEKFSIFQGKPAKMVSIMLLFTFSDFLFISPNFVCFSIELHCQLFKGDKNVPTNQCCHQVCCHLSMLPPIQLLINLKTLVVTIITNPSLMTSLTWLISNIPYHMHRHIWLLLWSPVVEQSLILGMRMRMKRRNMRMTTSGPGGGS